MSHEPNTLPDGYKMTELGPLPAHWQVVRLGEVVSLDRGVSWSKADESRSGIEVISIPDILGDGRVSPFPRVRISRAISQDKLLQEGDILLVGSSGSVHNLGRMGIVRDWKGQITFASFTVRARAVGAKLSKTFLAWLLQSSWVPFALFSKRAADGKYNLQLQ
ncbi:MAG: hypothetical protein NZ840_13725, partial [Anaerolineales bacterium]|nr:hypothetical protein [Anaerolineales bacterium]MDW8163093.1 hypothetical protein [Anaerolineales bacterium]